MTNKKSLLIISIIFIIFSVLFFGKTGNILIDFSRESFIPFQMNNGKYLIKDIFLIYGPFGYIFNSILYKFSLNINILLVLAHTIAYTILILFFFIVKKFTNQTQALLFSFALISVSIFSNSTFSFVMPYSYSTLWAILGIYATLYSIIYNKKNILFLSLGLILANKIELFIPCALISVAYLIYKKERFAKNSLFLFIFPILSFGYMLMNNINIAKIANNWAYLKNMLETSSLKYLYQGMGTFFEKEYFIYNILNLLKFSAIIMFSYIFYLKKHKKLSYATILIGFLYINTNFSLNLAFFISLGIILPLLFKKNITSEEIILYLFSLILCSKAIFAINCLSYSNFGYVILIFFMYLQLLKLIDKNWINFTFISFLIIL